MQFVILVVLFVTIGLTQSTWMIRNENPHLMRNAGPVCLTPGCVQAASGILKNMDDSIEPCDDFYKFACGGFLKETIIPDDKSFTISFNIISDRLLGQIRTVMEKPSESNEPKAITLLKKYYNVCMDTTAIDEDNLKTAKTIIKKLGGWPVLDGAKWNEDEFDWKKAMYKFREIGFSYDSILNVYVGEDSKNSTRRIMHIDQANLGLDREYLVKGDKNDVVEGYYKYLVDIAVIFGADRESATKELKETLKFEMELAEISVPSEDRRNSTALYNPTPIKELQKKYPDVNWLEYINTIVSTPGIKFQANDIIDIAVPKYVTDVLKLLNRTPKRVQANYVISQVVNSAVPYLTTELRNRELEYKKISEGKEANEARWKQCVEEAAKRLKISAGVLYVRSYFNEEAKQNAEELVADLRSTFRNLLMKITWMDKDTKCRALEKADAMASHVAYPSELLDEAKIEQYYTKLKPSDNYLLFNLKIQKFDDDYYYQRLPEPVNKTDWVDHSFATTVNAYYSVNENSIILPAGILQGIFFDNSRPNYMNYGTMGFGIGHEITHGFDDIGRQYDKNGNLMGWWEVETEKAFESRAQCMIDQYGNFTAPEVGMNLNGRNTQGENIADNGGAKTAYLAYSAWAKRNGEETRLPALQKYTPRQMFWISLANLWCTKARNAFLTQQILTDSHSPAYFRVVGSVSNSEDFARDFNCCLGSKMNPKHKCSVW